MKKDFFMKGDFFMKKDFSMKKNFLSEEFFHVKAKDLIYANAKNMH